MPPSKQILFGFAILVAGVVLQCVLDQLLAPYAMPGVAELQSNDVHFVTLEPEQIREFQRHYGFGWNLLTCALVIPAAGLALLITGIFQNARATERLTADSAARSRAGSTSTVFPDTRL